MLFAMEIRIGCSGYYYRHWKGRFYPEEMPASRWFSFYAGHFDTVEINASFYRFPTIKAVQRWATQAPEGFVYSVKAPRLITHLKRFHGCEALLDNLYTVLEGLGERLGCILFQTPPGLDFSIEALDRLLAAMHTDFRNVIEFRHPDWWRHEVHEALRARGIGFCSVHAPGLPDEMVVTSEEAYIRMHGIPWYAQDYSKEELERLAGRIRTLDAKRVWVYFNNDRDGFAPANATTLKATLKKLLAG